MKTYQVWRAMLAQKPESIMTLRYDGQIKLHEVIAGSPKAAEDMVRQPDDIECRAAAWWDHETHDWINLKDHP